MAATVGIVMGSDTDLPVLRKAVDALNEFGIECEVRVLSAHRTPAATLEWAGTAADRGLEVLIAGAGMAAHLPGVVAAVTHLPVIGVPIGSGVLDGLDALLAIAQMPPGVPVLTVGVDAGRNAGLAAVRILATADADLAAAYRDFAARQADKVAEKDAKVQAQFSGDRGFGFAGS